MATSVTTMDDGRSCSLTCKIAMTEEEKRNSFAFLVSTCVALVATTLIIVGQLLNENNIRGALAIGVSLLTTNILMTRHHYGRVKDAMSTRQNLPITQVESHVKVTERLHEDNFDSQAVGSTPAVRTHHKFRSHPRDQDEVARADVHQSLQEVQASSSRRKAVRKLRRKRRKEGTVRQGGLAGLGMSSRIVCI